MKRLCVILFVWGLLPNIVLTACRSTSESARVLRLQISSDPVSLDPALAEDGAALRLLVNMMEGLVGYDASGKLELRLAQSYTVSRGGLRWEFVLKQGLKWSDGQAVTVKDFVTGLRRSLNPKTASKLAEVFSMIRDPEKSIREEGGKLVIELSRPVPYLLQALAMSQALPEREDVLNTHGGVWPIDAPVTGAYRLVKYEPASLMEFERNLQYWRKQSVEEASHGFEKVKVFIVADDGTAKNLFEQGRIDLLGRVSAYDEPRFREKGWLRTDPFLATYYISFNTSAGIFSSRDARCAVAQAIDREGLVRSLRTGERYGESWIPLGLEGSFEHAPKSWKKPVTHFAKWLASVEADFDSSPRNTQVMEKVQADLKKRSLAFICHSRIWIGKLTSSK